MQLARSLPLTMFSRLLTTNDGMTARRLGRRTTILPLDALTQIHHVTRYSSPFSTTSDRRLTGCDGRLPWPALAARRLPPGAAKLCQQTVKNFAAFFFTAYFKRYPSARRGHGADKASDHRSILSNTQRHALRVRSSSAHLLRRCIWLRLSKTCSRHRWRRHRTA